MKNFKKCFTALGLIAVMVVSVFAGNIEVLAADERHTVQAQSSVVYICTPQELAVMSSGPASDGITYVLQNDIHLTHEWAPIEDFRGTFDGRGHTIHNLFVLESTGRPNAGLFGSMNNATVRNVVIRIAPQGVTAYSSTGSANAGGLSGGGGSNNITNVRVEGNVYVINTGGWRGAAGGVIGGHGSDNLTDVRFFGNVSVNSVGDGTVGGVTAGGGNFTNTHFVGDVTVVASGSGLAGGLIGAGRSSVERSSANANVSVTASAGAAGGLIGVIGFWGG